MFMGCVPFRAVFGTRLNGRFGDVPFTLIYILYAT